MRILVAFGLLCACAYAQDLTFYVDPTNGSTPCAQIPTTLTPLSPSTPYQFPDTPAGSSSSVFVQIVNTSTTPVLLASAYVGATAGTSTVDPDFTITGLDQSATIAPGSCSPFTLTFAPVMTGAIAGYLQAAYSVDGTGSNMAVTTLQGNGTPPQLTLTCSGVSACTSNAIQPSTTVNFGNVTQGSQATVTFTIENSESGIVTTPSVTLQTEQFTSSPFALNTSSLPASLAADGSATFTVAFAPSQVGGTSSTFLATLVVGSNSYQLEGVAVPSSTTPPGSDGPQTWYTNATGVKTYPNPATPINFTPATPLAANSTATLNFVILNPNPVGTSYADITLPSPPSVTGSSFTITNLMLAPEASGANGSASAVQPGQAVDIQPGWALTFQLVFTAGQQGTMNGTLTIPTIGTFSLEGSTAAPLNLILTCGSKPCAQTMSSDQQVQATLQLPSNAQAPASFMLTLAFTPAVKGISDDAAISFISPFNMRSLGPISFAEGSSVGTFQTGKSQFTFQTGTTAGTITLTATDNQTSQTQAWAISIPPSVPVIQSSSAQRQSPALVVTLDGYDNTYSASNVSFTFYDVNGNAILSSPTPESIVASDFHSYFFGPTDAGGMFAFQATFPVADGNATQVGSVTVTVTNSAGTASATSITFQ